MTRETLHVGSLADLDRVLAAATRLVRTHDELILVLTVAPLATDRLLAAALTSWFRRRAPELRARVRAIEVVMPSWATAVFMRLEMFLGRPPVRVTVRRMI